MKGLGKIFCGFILGMIVCFFVERGFKHRSADRAAKVAAKKETAMVADIKAHMNDSITYYHNALGQERAEKALIQGNAATVQIFYKKREDSLCNVLHIRNAQLKDMTEVVSQVNGSFTTKTQMVGEQGVAGMVPDDLPVGWQGYSFSYSDDYLQEKGWVDSVNTRVVYSMILPVNITTYWKRKWFLGKKHYFIDGFSPNKNVHITGLTGISINK